MRRADGAVRRAGARGVRGDVVRRHARVDGGGSARRRHDRGRLPGLQRGERAAAPAQPRLPSPARAGGRPVRHAPLRRGGVPRGQLPGRHADRQRGRHRGRRRARAPRRPGRHRRPLQRGPLRRRAGAARRGPAPARRAAREVHRRDDRERAGLRRRARRRRARPADRAQRAPGLHVEALVHAPGPAGREAVHAQPDVLPPRDLDGRRHPLRRAGRAGLADVELHADELRRAAVRAAHHGHDRRQGPDRRRGRTRR